MTRKPDPIPWPEGATTDLTSLPRGTRLRDATGHERRWDGRWPPSWWLPAVIVGTARGRADP